MVSAAIAPEQVSGTVLADRAARAAAALTARRACCVRVAERTGLLGSVGLARA